MTKTRMFPFITTTWNPLGGRCPHNCTYCWSMGDKGLVKKYNMKKYTGKICLIEKEFKRQFKDDDFVFVQDMSDLFANIVPINFVVRTLNYIKQFPKTQFLLLTKNPSHLYFAFADLIGSNCMVGITAETDGYYDDYSRISKASLPIKRLMYLFKIKHPRKFISIEPILNFNVDVFATVICTIRPRMVAIGYDNYKNNLPEPPLNKTEELIRILEENGIKVIRKTIRKAWYE